MVNADKIVQMDITQLEVNVNFVEDIVFLVTLLFIVHNAFNLIYFIMENVFFLVLN